LIGAVAAFLSLGIAFIAVNPVRLALTGFSFADVPAQFKDLFAAAPEDEARTDPSDTIRSAEQIPATSPDATRQVGEANLNQAPVVVPAAPPSVAQTQFAAVTPPPAAATPSVASDQIGEDEIAPLLQRSRELAAVGDVASARLILGRLVRTGNVEAMVNLAGTFDPAVLAKLRVTGSWSDPAKAQELYQMAAQAGSVRAQARLKDPAFQSKK
jgi:TPR repeat protein